MNLFEKHKTTLNKAIEALHARTFFAAYPEHLHRLFHHK